MPHNLVALLCLVLVVSSLSSSSLRTHEQPSQLLNRQGSEDHKAWAGERGVEGTLTHAEAVEAASHAANIHLHRWFQSNHSSCVHDDGLSCSQLLLKDSAVA